MHSITDCKAPTKCRNGGGPHRSESRNCLARPSLTGPGTKEQLEVIRQMIQREYHAVARAKAATLRSEVAVAAVESTKIEQTPQESDITATEVHMLEAPVNDESNIDDKL